MENSPVKTATHTVYVGMDIVADYPSSQPNRAGYQVSTKQGSGPSAKIRTHEYTAVICIALRSVTGRPADVGPNKKLSVEPIT